MIAQSNSQLVVNSINGKMGIPKDILNILEDVKFLLLALVIVE